MTSGRAPCFFEHRTDWASPRDVRGCFKGAPRSSVIISEIFLHHILTLTLHLVGPDRLNAACRLDDILAPPPVLLNAIEDISGITDMERIDGLEEVGQVPLIDKALAG